MSGPALDAVVADEHVDVVDRGALRWRYRFAGTPRPHVHPVVTPAGHELTVDAPEDHFWHHGLWFTIKFVDGDNYWEELPPFGVLRHQGPPTVEHLEVDGAPALRLSGTLDWRPPAPEKGGERPPAVLVEHRSLTHVPLGPDAYAVDLATELVAATDVLLDRTPFTTWGGYGGFTFRGRGDWHDTVITLADGSTHERVHGVPSAWFDLTGPISSPDVDTAAGAEPIVGVTMSGPMPSLAGEPVGAEVPWYGSTRADTYGDEGWSNFFNAAFLWDAPLPLPARTPLTFTHRLVVHDGPH